MSVSHVEQCHPYRCFLWWCTNSLWPI